VIRGNPEATLDKEMQLCFYAGVISESWGLTSAFHWKRREDETRRERCP
jgi:hypothetical protein